jgi:NAD(P) transhydrogenase subunit alpha
VIDASAEYGRALPMMMTAAGTVPAAKIFVMGVGVAGLQAIATAKRLGAVVWVSDVRPAVKEQVESLGGKFIDLPMQESGEGKGGYAKEMSAEFLAKQRSIITEHIRTADAVSLEKLYLCGITARPPKKQITKRSQSGKSRKNSSVTCEQ